ncbi:hypothetical protein ACVCAH_16255 [Micromonospora sp. LZ34]
MDARRHVVRNALQLAVAAAALVTVAVARMHPLAVAGVLVGVAAGSLGALILIRLDDLLELVLPTPSASLAPARCRRQRSLVAAAAHLGRSAAGDAGVLRRGEQ